MFLKGDGLSHTVNGERLQCDVMVVMASVSETCVSFNPLVSTSICGSVWDDVGAW